MKKSLFIMALGAIALTSCSQDEVLEVKQDAIAFSAITENASRATASTTLDKFKVYAYVTEDATTKTYINGLEATKTGEAWTLANGYYWPANAVDFYCVSNPVEGVDAGSLVLNASHQVENYTVASNHKNDLLYAVMKGKTKSNAPGGVLDLNFRHALSMIQFQIDSDENYGLDVNVSAIELVNVAQTNTYTLPEADTSIWLNEPDQEGDANHAQAGTVDGNNSRGLWAELDASSKTETYSWTGLDLTATSAGAESEKSASFFLLPQTVTAATPAAAAWQNSYFLISCTIKKNGVLIHKTTDAATKVAIPATAPDGEWKQGYKYLYTLKFGKGGGFQPGTTDPVVVPIAFKITVDYFQNAQQPVDVIAPLN